MLYAFALPASGLLDWDWLPDAVLFGLDPSAFEHDRIAAPISAAWLLVFALPLFLFTIFIASAYANSRTMLAHIAPEREMTKLLGLYALSSQLTPFVAPIMVVFFTGFFERQRVGFGSILILLGAGAALMAFVKEERAQALGEE